MLPIRRWYPFEGLTPLRDFDRVFDRLFQGPDWWPWIETAERFVPTLEAYVEGDEYHVRAEIPGVDPETIDLSLHDNMLTIKGERKTSKERKDEGYFLREIAYGRFERSVMLPEGADTEKINARYEKGVLHITVPVKGELAHKKVPVEVGAGEK